MRYPPSDRYLTKDYGKDDYYSPAQVNATLERYKLNKKYSAYALAMFCVEEAYAGYPNNEPMEVDYIEARSAVSQTLFGNYSNFKQTDLSTRPSVAGGSNGSTEGIDSSCGDGGGGGE